MQWKTTGRPGWANATDIATSDRHIRQQKGRSHQSSAQQTFVCPLSKY